MKKIILLLLFSLLNFTNAEDTSLKCGENSIAYCIECDSGDNSLCAKCEDKYFLYYDKKSCIACNDENYGQIGCEGNCDGSDYEKTRFAFCEEGGCKDGYFNLLGVCYECEEDELYGCAKCEIQPEGNNICLECESKEYKLTDSGTCERCEMEKCDKCFFNDDYTQKECIKCSNYYYKNSDGECIECRFIPISNGVCYICSDDQTNTDISFCNCDPFYINDGNNQCKKCPEGCFNCFWNEELNAAKCITCNDFYVINSEQTCNYCGDECKFCSLDESRDKTACLACKSGILLSDNTCPNSISDCDEHILKESSKEPICVICSEGYILNSENQCIKYEDDELETGCILYKNNEEKKECLKCDDKYYSYAYIINKYECLNNDNRYENYYGCIKANYNEETNNYECLQCKPGFTYIINNQLCININDEYNVIDFDLAPKCLEAYNHSSYYSCTKCIENASINAEGKCECDFGFFSKDDLKCYKCDDEKEGNPGCNREKGCTYYSNKQLNCNECKEGYFEYTKGQCFSCENEIPHCNKCHFDEDEQKLKCDNCKDIYIPDEENNKCILNDCNEYPEIAPGCIICKDKLDQYKLNNKCQTCKYGYFKTKEETCVYCRDEKYGGPSCYECGYEKDENDEETNNIICKDCFSIFKYINEYDSTFLLSNGKCYNAKYDFPEKCFKYELKKENDIEKLECTICPYGYYLNSEKKCINFMDKIETIPNCKSHLFKILNILFHFSPNSEDHKLYPGDKYNSNNDNYVKKYLDNFSTLNLYMNNMNFPIKTYCESCDRGYFINDEGKCEEIYMEKCSGHFIIQNLERRLWECLSFCYGKYSPIYLVFNNNNLIDYNFEYHNNSSEMFIDGAFYLEELSSIIYNYFIYINDKEFKNFILDNLICIKKETKFEGCYYIIYVPKTKSYHCLLCEVDYMLDKETGLCIRNKEYIDKFLDCDTENLGTNLSPKYSCKSCSNYYDILVSLDNGFKDCFEDYFNYIDIVCEQGESNSPYEQPLFNCTSCDSEYNLIYSNYYQRSICVRNIEDIFEEDYFPYLDSEEEENIPANEEGICQKNYFTPDGKKCYKCDNEKLGISGCKGECSFSSERYPSILCKSECKDGYIEISEGICKPCSEVKEHCSECHYEDSLPNGYIGIYKTRFVVCDSCKDGFTITKEGKCISCDDDLQLHKCSKCKMDEKTEEYICIECNSDDYFIGERGACEECLLPAIYMKGKCINCSDVNQGGVLNCHYCEKNEDGNNIICRECNDDYILLTNNNTCLKRENNEELKQSEFCLELKYQNDKYICSRCKPEFSLLNIDNNVKCTRIPTLYDSNFKYYYYYHYFYEVFNSHEIFYNYFSNDYNYKRGFYLPCKEAVNLGTKENPLYSCSECYTVFDSDKYNKIYNTFHRYDTNQIPHNDGLFLENEGNLPVKIMEISMNNISYCLQMRERTNNCLEAVYKILNGKEIYNCTKCIKDYILFYSEKIDINYCAKEEKEFIEDDCYVENCQECALDNSHFCLNCFSSDYDINKVTGSCVLKTETIPSITWKDVYRLNLNGQKEINGQMVTGPSLILRGITNSQINSKHAFLVYLTFKIRYGLRLLQETIKIKALCETDMDLEKTEENVNIVDYECIGTSTVDDNYELVGIEKDNDDENIKNSDFSVINEIIEETIKKGDDLSLKSESIFLTTDDIIVFIIYEDNKNKHSINNTFNFTLNGIINKDTSLSPNTLYDSQVEMFNITDETKCSFYLGNGREAKLSVFLELKNDVGKKEIYFKNPEIKISNENLIYAPILNEIVLNNDNEGTNDDLVPNDETEKKEGNEEKEGKEGNEEKEGNEGKEGKESSSKNKLLLIIIIVVVGVVVLSGIIIIVICLKKKK